MSPKKSSSSIWIILSALMILFLIAIPVAGIITGAIPLSSQTETDTYPHIDYQTKSDLVKEMTHTFTYQGTPLTLNFQIPEALYLAASLPEAKESRVYSAVSDAVWTSRYYQAVAGDLAQDEVLDPVISEFSRIKDNLGLTSDEYVELVTVYVQSIPYVTIDADPQFPVETLYLYRGDCDDKSLLLTAILSKEGYDVALFDLPKENHMTAAIAIDSQNSYQNTGYAMIETTDYFSIAEIPEETSGENLLVIPIGSGTKIYTAV